MTRLIDAYIPWFARVQSLVERPPHGIAEVVAQVDAWYAEARAAAAGANCPAEHAELAAFAAVAWADERLQTSDWEHAREWQSQLLQRRHFGVLDAGDAFFRQLGELGAPHQEVREVFALALLLGLRGRHALDAGDAAWRQARDAELARIADVPGEQGPAPLLVGTPGPRPTSVDAVRRWSGRMRAPWGMALASAAALALLFGAYAWLLRQAIRAWFQAD